MAGRRGADADVRTGIVRPQLTGAAYVAGVPNAPVVETTWWLRVSTFRQVIVSPATMLTVCGEKALRLICTVFVAASAGPDSQVSMQP